MGLGKKLIKNVNETVQKMETILKKIPEHTVKVEDLEKTCKGILDFILQSFI